MFTPSPEDLRHRKSKLLYSAFASFDSFDESPEKEPIYQNIGLSSTQRKEPSYCHGSKDFLCYCKEVFFLRTAAFKLVHCPMSSLQTSASKKLCMLSLDQFGSSCKMLRPRKRKSFVQKQTTFAKSSTTQTQTYRYQSEFDSIHVLVLIEPFQLGDTTICVVKQGSLHKTRLSEGGKKYR